MGCTVRVTNYDETYACGASVVPPSTCCVKHLDIAIREARERITTEQATIAKSSAALKEAEVQLEQLLEAERSTLCYS